MMVLAIDTSCEQASCAINDNGVVRETRSPEDKRRHSSVLMPMVMQFLEDNGFSLDEVDLFAVGSGPGSFTGIRIGMASVKGMAFIKGRGIYTAKSLDILANRYDEKAGTVCPMIDARNGQVYTAIYRWNGEFHEPVTGYIGISVERLSEMLAIEKEPVTLCGDAHGKYLDFLRDEKGLHGILSDESNKYPSAAVLAVMAAKNNPLGETGSASGSMPFYLRESQAERLYDSDR
jgi:tRNA threonylcarbamoyladenosine biosynthesis protein TsaB